MFSAFTKIDHFLFAFYCLCRQFEHLTLVDEKVGEKSRIVVSAPLSTEEAQDLEDTSCGLHEEGQSYSDLPAAPQQSPNGSRRNVVNI